jgi:hypothetical protein
VCSYDDVDRTRVLLVGFEVLTAVVMKSSIFWHSPARYLLQAGFLLGSFFDPEDGGDICFRNVGSTDYTAL